MSLIPTGAYINEVIPWWSQDVFGTPANIEVSTLTVNPVPAGNILLQNPAPLIFQRAAGDPNAPSESLVMISSIDVPTKLVNGQYIAATKAAGTAYDDIAVQGLQVYGNQTTTGNLGAAAYITGDNGNLILAAKNSVLISSLAVSSLIAGTIISTAINTATSYTATLFMSTPILNTDSISSVAISTNVIQGVTGNFSTLNVSTLNAPSFVASTLSTIAIDAKFTLTSTLSLTGNPTNIDLGLGDVIQGLVGGAATQALGAGLGGAGLITGAAALVTGRTSGGVNPNIFQTINGSTQLQFSTIGSAVSSVFLTTISPDPLTTPGLETSITQGVPAGTYCVRSVGDPLYITNNVSSIQMFGQWVPVIQPTATASALAISSLNVSSVNGATYPPPGGGGIPSTLAISTATINGNFTQSGTGTFNWGGNTMSPTQVVLNRATAINNTLTTTAGAFLNGGATINAGLVVASGGMNVSGFTSLTGGASVTNGLNVASGTTTFGGQANFNQNASVFGALTVNNGSLLYGSVILPNGSLAVQQFGASVNASILSAGLTMRSPALSTINISTANINVSSVNGAAYPPGGGGGLPSTLAASTLTVNGGQTITNGALIVTSGGISVVTDGINVGSGNVLIQDAISVNGLATLNGGVRTFAVSTNTISSASLFISSINGAVYPPPGGGGIPSTLNASTINVNGGQTITNGGLTISGGGTISDGGKWKYRMANVASAVSFEQAAGNNDSVILDLNSDKTTRFYSTLVVRDSPFPSLQPSQASIRTYTTTDPAPYGSVITSNVSTFNVASQYATISTISTSFMSSGIITASNIGCFNFSSLSGSINTFVTSNVTAGVSITTPSLFTTNIQTSNTITSLSLTTSTIAVSTINGTPYPPPSPGITPTGSIVVWAGGFDGGSSLNPQNFNVPAGWLACDGMAVQQSVYFALYSVIGNKFNRGVTPNPGLFFLPDLTFAVPMGTPYRNYFSNEDLTKPNFQIEFQTWTSTYIDNPGYEACWYISQTIGGTLNLGTKFVGTTISSGPAWPDTYVTKILNYNGYQGFIIVRNTNNLLPIPSTGGVNLTITANGVVDRIPTTTGDYIYTLGTYNVNGRAAVTHNQTIDEVATHQHAMGAAGPVGPANSFVVGAPYLANSILPLASPGGPPYGQSTISTIGTGPPGLPDVTNIGTYTAPNFLNMLYIIKT